jgi:hypothetical protein
MKTAVTRTMPRLASACVLYPKGPTCDTPRRAQPGGDEGEQVGQLCRRQFARAAVKAGMAAGAAVWVAPQLSSVALAQTNAGSPPAVDDPSRRRWRE